jgi:hypothetical protein
MHKHFSRVGLPMVMLAVSLLFVHFRVFGQRSNSSDTVFGTWKMDQAKSFSHRADEEPTFTTQHMRILTQEGDDGFRNTLINSPGAAPAYSYTAKLDGKEYPDPRGRADRTLTHWRLGSDRALAENGR